MRPAAVRSGRRHTFRRIFFALGFCVLIGERQSWASPAVDKTASHPPIAFFFVCVLDSNHSTLVCFWLRFSSRLSHTFFSILSCLLLFWLTISCCLRHDLPCRPTLVVRRPPSPIEAAAVPFAVSMYTNTVPWKSCNNMAFKLPNVTSHRHQKKPKTFI